MLWGGGDSDSVIIGQRRHGWLSTTSVNAQYSVIDIGFSDFPC